MKKALYLILAGIAIGILVAPAKGSETWQKIKDSLDDLKDDAVNHVNDIVDKGKDLANDVKIKSGEVAGEW